MTARTRATAAGAARLPFCTEIIPAVSLDGSRIYRSAIDRRPVEVVAAILDEEERRFGLPPGARDESFALRAERALRQRMQERTAERMAFSRRFGG